MPVECFGLVGDVRDGGSLFLSRDATGLGVPAGGPAPRETVPEPRFVTGHTGTVAGVGDATGVGTVVAVGGAKRPDEARLRPNGRRDPSAIAKV